MTQSQSSVLLESNLPDVPLLARGKVRDVYDLGENLLIIASDRLSAFDYILATGIPDKGRVLTQISIFWFEFLSELVPTHFITADVAKYPSVLHPYAAQLEGRSMLVRKAQMFPVECVARGYLSGSAWKDYQRTGAICGIPLPAGMFESDRLPEAMFTPATKASSGHDENIPMSKVVSILGAELAGNLKDLTLRIYERAVGYAEKRGIIIADTKFEFGMIGSSLVLADEVLTPDSSRFWPAATYKPGGPQLSYDKQYVRDYLEQIGWNKQPPAPALPDDVARNTSEKYKEAYRALTGRHL